MSPNKAIEAQLIKNIGMLGWNVKFLLSYTIINIISVI